MGQSGHSAMRNIVVTALLGALLGEIIGAGPAAAQVLSSRNRSAAFASQTDLIDRRLSSQYAHSRRLIPTTPDTAAGLGAERIPRYDGSQRSAWIETARAAARRNGIPEDLFLRLVRQESGWNPTARSVKGAMGLAQLMPETARRLGVDPNDPRQNLEGGARYLSMQYRKFGTWRLALAAYNAGPGAVEAHRGVPPFRETRDYVRVILGQG